MKKDKTTSPSSSLLSRWKNRTHKTEGALNIKKIPKGEPVPLSSEQKRLWFLQQLYPNNPFYNFAELYKLKGPLQLDAFKKSIRLIEGKHDVLRSNFQVEEGIPVTHILEETTSTFNYYDLSEHPLEKATQRATAILAKEARHSFSLSDKSLMRSTVVKIAPRDFRFLILMHHIITDDWSMKIFRKELSYNYGCLLKGDTPVQKRPSIQYADYAFWQNKREINREHLTYWKGKLSGEIPILKLPLDHPKKAQPTYNGAFHEKKYDTVTSKSFFDLCKKLEATPYVTMLSLYYILLYKYAGQNDILVGTPITKREDKSLENLIGFFNDTLVLRHTVEEKKTFRDLVRQVKQVTLDAFTHKDISFDTLVSTIKPTRSISIHPFFQVMFLYHKVPQKEPFGNDIDSSYELYDSGIAKFDITLYIEEDEDSVRSILIYEKDLFEVSTISRMHSHFQLLLEGVLYDPDVIIADLSMQTPFERVHFEKLELPVSPFEIPEQSIYDIIKTQALKTPNATAVVFEEEHLTYSVLEIQVTLIAQGLINMGVGRNTIVGLSIERSHHMIVGLLGILKAGAAYLPLDPTYPAERTKFILDNASAKALLTQDKLAQNFTEVKAAILTLESAFKIEKDSTIIYPEVCGSDLAYVIYTSGSTGKPKGVPITHQNIINSTKARSVFYEKDPSTFLLMSSISFDSSKAGIFWSLCTGATLVISQKHLEQDIDLLTNVIQKHQVSHTLILPSLYANVIALGELKRLESLETVIVAGEACTIPVVKVHFSKLPQVQLYNEYGPTESTVWCIAHKLVERDSSGRSVPIGRPIKNCTVLLLNERGQKVPYGTSGELYLGGLGLSSGYLNDPVKTANAFVKNPYNPEQRLYKTGDLARYREDGAIEFLGRKDQQVKLRGYRIELDEIETAIVNSAQIQKAVVVIEDEYDAIDWNFLEDTTTQQLIRSLEKYISIDELHNILDTIESMEDEAIAMVLEKLA